MVATVGQVAYSEAATFARVRTACQSGNLVMMRHALMCWLDCIHEGKGMATVEQFVQDAGDNELRDQAERLNRGRTWSNP